MISNQVWCDLFNDLTTSTQGIADTHTGSMSRSRRGNISNGMDGRMGMLDRITHEWPLLPAIVGAMADVILLVVMQKEDLEGLSYNRSWI